MPQDLPYGRQEITEADIQAVVDVLRSPYLTQGPAVAAFERAFAAYVDAPHAVAVANGTAALHLGALALGIQPGQKVITTPITFAASANCVRYCGGEVEFVDIDPETLLIDIDAVAERLASAPAGTYAGVVPVDFAGRAVDTERLRSVTAPHGVWILEDACHAPGGFLQSSPTTTERCGSARHAHAAIFSFHPVKHMTSGEGGMITTRDPALVEQLRRLRTHGITRDTQAFQNDLDLANGGAGASTYPGWYMEMQELGFNYRLTDIQSALGLSQLARADAGLARRREIARQYDEAFTGHPRIRNDRRSVAGHAFHLYVVEVDERRKVYDALHAAGIKVQIHYLPLHLMPYYRQLGWKPGDFPCAETYYQRCLSLPIFATMTNEDVERVISELLSILG